PAWITGTSPPPVYTEAGDPSVPTLQYGACLAPRGPMPASPPLTGHRHHLSAPPSQWSLARRPRRRPGSPRSTSPPMTARRTRLTGSTSASNFSVDTACSRRSALGSRPTTSAMQPRHGTTPSSRTRAACPRRSASVSCASFGLGRRCTGAAWLSWAAYPSLHGAGFRGPLPGPGVSCARCEGPPAGRTLCRRPSRSHPRGRRAEGAPRPPDGQVLCSGLRAARPGCDADTIDSRGPATPPPPNHPRQHPRLRPHHRLPPRLRRDLFGVSLRRSSSNAGAWGFALTVMRPTPRAMYDRDSSTWRRPTRPRMTPGDGLGDPAAEEPAPTPAPAPAPATALVVSLHALAGIRDERTMLLPVTTHGKRLVALLDTGSTHNFLPEATMRRLALQPTGGEQLRVIVANGDRLRYHGLARDVPITIGDEHFTITCAGIDLGCFDFILGVDFLRTLGPILWDFDALTMTFWRLGRRV
uniref:Peptidase A2 domain-containing protein n=1 Tax=Aegilops tauschii subsp. strangulata TaxID=200361 RepID=A0A452XR88_AEGTS